MKYQKLVNSLPLPVFLNRCIESPVEIVTAANELACSQLLIINFLVPHPTQRDDNWIYVYDKDKLSTRISISENFSEKNVPKNHTGIQVEVYFSKTKRLPMFPAKVALKVLEELKEMGFILSSLKDKEVKYHIHLIHWANIIFNTERRKSLGVILDWLENYGLHRESDDLEPISNWSRLFNEEITSTDSSLALTGRFGKWKYFWSDDCILSGLFVSKVFEKSFL